MQQASTKTLFKGQYKSESIEWAQIEGDQIMIGFFSNGSENFPVFNIKDFILQYMRKKEMIITDRSAEVIEKKLRKYTELFIKSQKDESIILEIIKGIQKINQ